MLKPTGGPIHPIPRPKSCSESKRWRTSACSAARASGHRDLAPSQVLYPDRGVDQNHRGETTRAFPRTQGMRQRRLPISNRFDSGDDVANRGMGDWTEAGDLRPGARRRRSAAPTGSRPPYRKGALAETRPGDVVERAVKLEQEQLPAIDGCEGPAARLSEVDLIPDVGAAGPHARRGALSFSRGSSLPDDLAHGIDESAGKRCR